MCASRQRHPTFHGMYNVFYGLKFVPNSSEIHSKITYMPLELLGAFSKTICSPNKFGFDKRREVITAKCL